MNDDTTFKYYRRTIVAVGRKRKTKTKMANRLDRECQMSLAIGILYGGLISTRYSGQISDAASTKIDMVLSQVQPVISELFYPKSTDKIPNATQRKIT